MPPLISIITATYNRSNILSYTIRSVVDQSISDWELLVVGDCCTDDTEQVVQSFNDPRIKFINLPKNFGEQSGPNNEGLQRAQGRYIAFLNHDDLWFPDHLSLSLACIEANNADLVLAGGFIDHANEAINFDTSGVLSGQHGYHPSRVFVPASNWLFRRKLIDEVGFWRPASQLYLVPSHDWLQRVFLQKKKILPTERFTVLAIPSSSRRNSYSERQSLENEWYYTQMKANPAFREELLSKKLYRRVQEQLYDEKAYMGRYIRKKLKNLLIGLGFNTIELNYRKRFRKGGIIKRYRQHRGLDTK